MGQDVGTLLIQEGRTKSAEACERAGNVLVYPRRDRQALELVGVLHQGGLIIVSTVGAITEADVLIPGMMPRRSTACARICSGAPGMSRAGRVRRLNVIVDWTNPPTV
jgi:hypothetical protein